MQGTWLHLQNSHRLHCIDDKVWEFMNDILDNFEQGNNDNGWGNNNIAVAILMAFGWAAAFGYLFKMLIDDGLIWYVWEISDTFIA